MWTTLLRSPNLQTHKYLFMGMQVEGTLKSFFLEKRLKTKMYWLYTLQNRLLPDLTDQLLKIDFYLLCQPSWPSQIVNAETQTRDVTLLWPKANWIAFKNIFRDSLLDEQRTTLRFQLERRLLGQFGRLRQQSLQQGIRSVMVENVGSDQLQRSAHQLGNALLLQQSDRFAGYMAVNKEQILVQIIAN